MIEVKNQVLRLSDAEEIIVESRLKKTLVL